MIEGLDGGQTQVDRPPDGDMAVWGHPLDVHYMCRGLSGWPKLHVQVWSQDVHGRNELSECLGPRQAHRHMCERTARRLGFASQIRICRLALCKYTSLLHGTRGSSCVHTRSGYSLFEQVTDADMHACASLPRGLRLLPRPHIAWDV